MTALENTATGFQFNHDNFVMQCKPETQVDDRGRIAIEIRGLNCAARYPDGRVYRRFVPSTNARDVLRDYLEHRHGYWWLYR